MTKRPRALAETLSATAFLTALTLSAMWGANMVAIKVSLEAVPPIWGGFWRMLGGLPILWLWSRALRVDLRPGPGEMRFLATLAVLFAGQLMLLNWSVDWTSAAYSAVLVNSAPLFTNLIAHFVVPDDKVSRDRLLGLVLAFSGVVCVVAGDPDDRLASAPLAGNLLSVATAALIGVRMVYTQRLVQRLDPIRTIFWQVALSSLIFLAAASATEPMLIGPLTPRVLKAMAYGSFGVVGIAFILWVRLLQKHPPGMLSVFVFPTPLFGVLFSALVFGERVGSMLLWGMLGVAFGILIVTWEKRRGSTAN